MSNYIVKVKEAVNEQSEITLYVILKTLGIEEIERDKLKELRKSLKINNSIIRRKGKKLIYTNGYKRALSDSKACGCNYKEILANITGEDLKIPF